LHPLRFGGPGSCYGWVCGFICGPVLLPATEKQQRTDLTLRCRSKGPGRRLRWFIYFRRLKYSNLYGFYKFQSICSFLEKREARTDHSSHLPTMVCARGLGRTMRSGSMVPALQPVRFVVNDRKFPARIVFFSHTKPASSK